MGYNTETSLVTMSLIKRNTFWEFHLNMTLNATLKSFRDALECPRTISCSSRLARFSYRPAS